MSPEVKKVCIFFLTTKISMYDSNLNNDKHSKWITREKGREEINRYEMILLTKTIDKADTIMQLNKNLFQVLLNTTTINILKAI